SWPRASSIRRSWMPPERSGAIRRRATSSRGRWARPRSRCGWRHTRARSTSATWPGADGYAAAVTEGGLKFELERAITENELVLHYQPRVLVSTLELRGVYALVRWRHPIRGIVPPAEFVAAAARSGLVHDLD